MSRALAPWRLPRPRWRRVGDDEGVARGPRVCGHKRRVRIAAEQLSSRAQAQLPEDLTAARSTSAPSCTAV